MQNYIHLKADTIENLVTLIRQTIDAAGQENLILTDIQYSGLDQENKSVYAYLLFNPTKEIKR